MTNLTTLNAVKRWLNLQDSSDSDQLLSDMLAGASAAVRQYLSRDVLSASFDWTTDGTGSDRMMTREFPVLSVSLLEVDFSPVPVSVRGSPGYVAGPDKISLIGYKFTKGHMNVHVVYTAGWDTVPKDIEWATIELIAGRFKEQDRIGMISKTLAGETVAYSQKDMTDSVKSKLNPYRRVSVV